MPRAIETFSERFSIKGISETILFTFRILREQSGTQYKVRTDNPESDFNMQSSLGLLAMKFVYSDPMHMPAWLTSDKDLQAKISSAINFEEGK